VEEALTRLVELTANTWQVFSGGRVIAYFAVGIVENIVPSYLSEIAPAGLRGFFAAIMNIVVSA
jgi:SP family sugar:H+ symporter-like MFS transporter